MKIGFNADRGIRTLTGISPADFESAASAIPPHPHLYNEINFIIMENVMQVGIV